MGLSKNYFMELQEMYQTDTKMVEKVKLGDILHIVESKKAFLESLIKDRELEIVAFNNELNTRMVNYCQSRIDAYKFTIQELDSMYSLIKLYK